MHKYRIMRKITLTISLLFLSFWAVAQQGFSIGLHLSPIISYGSVLNAQKNKVDGLDLKTRLGLSYGLIFNYGFTDNYAFHSGVHIVSKGFRAKQGATDPLLYRVTAVEVPLGIKLRSNEIAEGLHVKGLFGASLDINVSHQAEVLGTGNQVTTTRETNRINPLGFTFIFGPGLDIVTDFGTFTLGVIYHQGLVNVNNKNKSGDPNTIRLNYVSLDLGYIF